LVSSPRVMSKPVDVGQSSLQSAVLYTTVPSTHDKITSCDQEAFALLQPTAPMVPDGKVAGNATAVVVPPRYIETVEPATQDLGSQPERSTASSPKEQSTTRTPS